MQCWVRGVESNIQVPSRKSDGARVFWSAQLVDYNVTCATNAITSFYIVNSIPTTKHILRPIAWVDLLTDGIVFRVLQFWPIRLSVNAAHTEARQTSGLPLSAPYARPTLCIYLFGMARSQFKNVPQADPSITPG